MTIKQIRNKIKEQLIAGFEAVDKTPYVFITSFPESAKALESLQKEAMKYSENGVFYIAWSAERPGQKVSGLYTNFLDVFTIYIFSDNKESDEEIIDNYELVRNILHKSYFLYYGEMYPVKSAATGLYMAAIQVGLEQIYQG